MSLLPHAAPLLSIRTVSKDFVADGRAVRAVDGVSFDVGAGECLAIVGAASASKSTLPI
jgi:ABC-type glutathione transport system ATPase component